jgi:GNAT superfamily N-acetyltransferase
MCDAAPVGPIIREARPADADAVSGLMHELGHPASPQEAADRIGVFSRNPGYIMFVAEIEGSVVGLVAGYVAERVDRRGRYGVISAMAVTAARRRCGVGRQLLRRFEQWAGEQGAGSMRLTSQLRRAQDAHRFYPALGYERTGYRFEKDLGPY